MTVTGFFHVGVTVSDMSRALVFYCDGLGLEHERSRVSIGEHVAELIGLEFSSINNEFLAIPGGGTVELLEYVGIDRVPATGRPCDPGSSHLCLYVTDIVEVSAKACRFGGQMRSAAPITVPSGPGVGTRIVYIEDPDGFVVELLQRADSLQSSQESIIA